MVAVRDSLIKQIAVCDRAIRQLAKKDAAARRLMTLPGGPVVTLANIAVIDDPQRFRHSRDVGAYLGITPKRYQSARSTRRVGFPKCGDGFARTCLYEAAGVLLTRVDRWSPLKAWGVRLMQRVGATRPKSRLPGNWLSSCIGSGSTAPNSGGRKAPHPPDSSSTHRAPREWGRCPCRDGGWG